MSTEDRLRQALADQADWVQPATESSLSRLWVRERRRKVGRAFAVAVVLLVCLIGGAVLVGVDDHYPVAVPVAGGTRGSASLEGTFAARVATPKALAGRWTLRLTADGNLKVTPPPSYQGLVSGELYSATADEFRTTLFQSDVCSGSRVGAYRWQTTRAGVEFSVRDDPCAARTAFFDDNTWLSTR